MRQRPEQDSPAPTSDRAGPHQRPISTIAIPRPTCYLGPLINPGIGDFQDIHSAGLQTCKHLQAGFANRPLGGLRLLLLAHARHHLAIRPDQYRCRLLAHQARLHRDVALQDCVFHPRLHRAGLPRRGVHAVFGGHAPQLAPDTPLEWLVVCGFGLGICGTFGICDGHLCQWWASFPGRFFHLGDFVVHFYDLGGAQGCTV